MKRFSIFSIAALGLMVAAALVSTRAVVSLDASLDFCALCFVMAGLDRLGLKLT